MMRFSQIGSSEIMEVKHKSPWHEVSSKAAENMARDLAQRCSRPDHDNSLSSNTFKLLSCQSQSRTENSSQQLVDISQLSVTNYVILSQNWS